MAKRGAVNRRGAWGPLLAQSEWRPGALMLGQVELKNGTTDIGLSILSIGTTMSVWSAISPSFFTYRAFASKTEEERASARTTMFLAGGASLLMSAGVFLVFRRTLPAVAGVVSTAALFALSWMAVHGSAPGPSTMEEKRQQQIQQRATEAIPQTSAP